MASEKGGHVNVVVVVSGVPRAERINLESPLTHLVQEVLRASGDHGRVVEDFELRTEDGRLLDLRHSGQQEGLQEGQTLFLNPRAGAGG